MTTLAACSDSSGPDPDPVRPPSAALVSSSQPPPAGASRAAIVTGQTYVSMVPGTDTNGRRVDIRNLRNGATATSPMSNGGFDPVAVEAEAGDTLAVTVVHHAGDDTTGYGVVPVTSKPRIVRSSPGMGKTDVPLNTLIVVVFNQPMDEASLAQSLRLRQGGADVAGTAVGESRGGVVLNGKFVPAGPLSPLTIYELSVSTAAKTQAGASLDAPFAVEFTTGIAAGLASAFAYVWQGRVLAGDLDGSEPVALADEATRPAWSPDGEQIAFTRPTDDHLALWQLCVARADGSDPRCAVGDRDGTIRGRPSWSPDGNRLAFAIFIHSCPGGDCGQFGGFFTSLRILTVETMVVDSIDTPPLTSVSWSPDGSRIAFSAFGVGTFGRGALGVVNPDGSGLSYLAMSLGSYSVDEVAWSPDGQRLALALADENACPFYCDTAIGVTQADGTQLNVLATAQTADDRYLTWPAWSPDGARVAYTLSDGESSGYDAVFAGSDILVVDADGGVAEVLVSGGGLPAWRE